MPITTDNNGDNFHSAPGAVNLAYVEGIYEDYLRDPGSVAPDWQQFFTQYADREVRFPKPRFGPSFTPRSIFNPPSAADSRARNRLTDPQVAALQDRVYLLTR